MALPGLYKIFNDAWAGQTVWIISDPHFGDEDLRAGIPGRLTDEELVRRINAKCGRKDVLICLGDVGDIEFAKKLHGYKVLICGNHDVGATNYERQIVKKIYDADIWNQDSAVADMKTKYPGWKIRVVEDYEFHAPFRRWNIYADNYLFDEVYTGPLMIGEKLLLSHEPVPAAWYVNIHGHDHTGRKRKGCINVCLDANGYEPINMNQLLKSGIYKDVESIHRITIDVAIERKKKRGGKKIGKNSINSRSSTSK